MNRLIATLALLLSLNSIADITQPYGLIDSQYNSLTTNLWSGSRNPLDTELVISGSVIDPRNRNWTLLNTTDSVNSVQSGTWTTGRTWTLGSGTDSVTSIQGTSNWTTNLTQFGGSAVVTGIGASGAGIPRFSLSNDSLIKLWDGTNTTAVKAASTAPVAADTSLVVGLSPNGNQATAADQTNGNQKTQIVDGSGNIAGPITVLNSVNYLPVAQQQDQVGTGSITVQDTASTTTTGFNNQTYYSGTPTTGSAVQFTVASFETAMITVEGTWTGTLQTEISTDTGTTWIPHSLHQIGSPNFITAFTANFQGSLNLAAKNWVRVRATAAMTGTATVRITQSLNPSSVYVANAVKLLDGSSQTSSNTLTIKGASTAPVATDTSAVVTLSPNSSLPAPSDISASGTLTSTSTSVTLNLNGQGSLNIDVSGTWVGTIVVNEPGVAVSHQLYVQNASTSAYSSSITANGNYRVVGLPASATVGVTFQSYTSGSATIGMRASTATFFQQSYQLNASNLLTSSWLSDGSGNALSSNSGNLNSNLTQVGGTNISTGTGASGAGIPRVTVANDSKVIAWDGTNTSKVVVASTNPSYTDTALEVTQRPDATGSVTQTSISCATTSTTLLAASTATMFISIRNPTSATATVWINYAGAAAVTAAPSVDLAPGSEADFFAYGPSWLPTSAFTCISGGASASTLTLIYK